LPAVPPPPPPPGGNVFLLLLLIPIGLFVFTILGYSLNKKRRRGSNGGSPGSDGS
jgi:hypothetical protein